MTTNDEKGAPLAEWLAGQGYDRVDLKRSAVGHFEIEAQVNGNPVHMIIDTGASHTVLDAGVAKGLGVTVTPVKGEAKGPCMSGTMGPLGDARLDELRLDAFTMESLSVAVLDLSDTNTALDQAGSTAIGGILGADFLHRTAAVIEYADKRLYLKPQA